ncbi:MAG TPA: galactokinase [Candidatus Sulfotelmatobacter sp.]|nr:galactokinase [Candidatus Sulfotelmatobacter sp.]
MKHCDPENGSPLAMRVDHLFRETFGSPPQIYRAPGRVNLIGEHTDYNQGFVMPAAIDRYCWVAIALRPDRILRIHSTIFSKTVSVDLGNTPLAPRGDWSDYVVGTAWALGKSGHNFNGADILIHSEVPIGAGLSSSASLEIAVAYALLDINGLKIDSSELIQAGHRAENEFVGAHVGLMDQFICANGEEGHLLMLDCRSLRAEPLPLPPELCLVVCNTGVKHQIAGGEYNLRRLQCEEGVRRLAAVLPGIQALRDVAPGQLEEHKRLLPELIYRRCRHVVTEDERVESAARALRDANFPLLGRLMAESHRSLRDDYEVSCMELDQMVELAGKQSGVVGARMTGGGFGGCTVNLVQSNATAAFVEAVARDYERNTSIHPEIYVFRASRGVHEVPAKSSV